MIYMYLQKQQLVRYLPKTAVSTKVRKVLSPKRPELEDSIESEANGKLRSMIGVESEIESPEKWYRRF